MENKKLGVIALAALVVSAMIGGGIFSLPQNMAQGAGVTAVIVAWVVTGAGMFFLANTFRILSEARPEATTGIYSYARMGFGRFAGFEMAWSYWLCNIFGNVGYAVLLMDAFNFFFPGVFTGGNNLWAILGGSVIIWVMNFAVLAGVRQAAFINMIGTVFKLMPLLIFILVMIAVFRWSCFTTDMNGMETIPADSLKPLGSMLSQVKSTMLVTLWCFIGIEGAVVVSGRAKSPSAVGKATVMGFLCCLAIYFLLSVLPFGRMYQSELAALKNPSTAPLLRDAVHASWGMVLMNTGVIIAILTSWLAFTIMIAQIPFAAALDGTFPNMFRRENSRGTPSVSLWVSSIVMQLCMILVYFANNAWNTMLSITGVMILPPYLACTLYLWKLCVRGGIPADCPVKKGPALFCGVAGSLYSLWMIYAAGIDYMLMAFAFILVGIPFFIIARKQSIRRAGSNGDQKIFTPGETVGALLIVAVCAAAVILYATGHLKL